MANPEKAHLEALEQENRELREALFRLERWSSCFIEGTPISAETLWRRFPSAVHAARAVLRQKETAK